MSMPLCFTLTELKWLNKVFIFYSCSFPNSLFFSIIALSFLTLTFHKSLLCASLCGVGGYPIIWLAGSYFPNHGLNLGPQESPNQWTTSEFPGFLLLIFRIIEFGKISPNLHVNRLGDWVTHLKSQNFSYVELSPDSLQCFFFFTSFPRLCFYFRPAKNVSVSF